MKIGIIGAENSHTVHISKIINIAKQVRGFSVDYIWGETAECAKKAAEEGKIPNIVKKPEQMLGKIDALIVDHRHPKYHLPAAIPFVENGIPTFIDKPFCYRTKEGREFLKVARKHKTPVTSFSVIPEQRSFINFVEKLSSEGDILSGTMYGPCDLKSKWGGIFFYGIHQVDAALKAFGYNVVKVLVVRNGSSASGNMIYSDNKLVTLNFLKSQDFHKFAITAVCTKGVVHAMIDYDENPYLEGIKTFTKMFKTGIEPESHENILRPVEVLETMEKSAKSGKIVKVSAGL